MSDPDRKASDDGVVVVGVDGSEGSKAALGFAMGEAALRNLRLRVVTAFEPPDLWTFTAGLSADLQALRNEVKEQVASIVDAEADARTRRGEAVPPVEVEVDSGPATPVLERLSRGAALLVVGHRGRGEFASKLIGSVGLNCVVHANCTVVVVRA